MTDLADYADPQLLEDPRTVLLVLRAAEFSDDADVLDNLARCGVTSEVLRKIAHNPATTEHTLEHLIDLDQRWMTYPVTRRTDLTAKFIDRIARRLTDRTAIFHASSAPQASDETLRYLAEHPSAPPATAEQVAERLGKTAMAAA
ncbi:MAG: hypothetical protein L0G94_18745 [Brachybacterium sp.]|uniref:hypothetical protein n=1 Tax=Brachybacterium sp. TaxID=1891286 RepID=UPI0026492D18|nr:hypothetical protein [Brachybacterium sp.]MDN5688694.1 hypothetical protein [Brachybacterium sp.]